MRVRTAERRQAILDQAAQVFLEQGYARTSMAAIAERIGGSKATLYGYFPSKEALFVAITAEAGDRHLADAMTLLEALDDGVALDLRLRRFGEKVIAFLARPDTVALHRTVIAESCRSSLGRMFHASGPQRGQLRIANALKQAMDRGQMRRADASLAATHLMALLGAEWQMRLFVDDQPQPGRARLRTAAERAVAVFLHGYAP